MKELTQRDFGAATAHGVVLVDFNTEWCAPCKTMMPVMERISSDYSGRVNVYSVDAGEQAELSSGQMVMSFPTFLLFKDGRVVDRIIGAVSDPKLRARIDAVL
jgi:thioredoxin 1